MRERHGKLIGEIKEAPDADAIAVIAPRVIALGLRFAMLCIVVTAPLAERMHRDVGGQAERKALPARPGIVLALGQRRILVSIVARKHGSFSVCKLSGGSD